MKKMSKELISLSKILVVTYIIVSLMNGFILRPVIVSGSSMMPTLNDKDIGFSYVITKKLFGLERGSTVTVYVENEDQYLVKRVVGMPGETIFAKDGIVYINDKALKETYLDVDFKNSYESLGKGPFTKDFDKIRIPNEMYFLMGDNRANSLDSRDYGPFKDEDIKSNSLFIIYPFKDFGIK